MWKMGRKQFSIYYFVFSIYQRVFLALFYAPLTNKRILSIFINDDTVFAFVLPVTYFCSWYSANHQKYLVWKMGRKQFSTIYYLVFSIHQRCYLALFCINNKQENIKYLSTVIFAFVLPVTYFEIKYSIFELNIFVFFERKSA